ncbi:tail protein X [Paraneptunicella aestuarii]|uniref:tail protein X n=1 Tax=Paraneptunicella aestuarii TaxID=2831148 RepID=UPI001E617504|nr:tail protein X [Paraneptunicella aestuarii]UAA38227.1 tail protein X [Paraneptunicella aestuarii]
MRYRTIQGQTVDEIAWRYYGYTQGSTEAILNANCGLADYGVRLPGGLVIDLPEFEPPQQAQGVRLWD